MFRFTLYALPLLLLAFSVFGVVVEQLDGGSVSRAARFAHGQVPAGVILGSWTMEAMGLLALFLLLRGRTGRDWLDGLLTGWIAWIFRGPLLVITMVLAVRQPQDPWWDMAWRWWWLYSLCGLMLAMLAGRMIPKPVDALEDDHSGAGLPASGDAPRDGPAMPSPAMPTAAAMAAPNAQAATEQAAATPPDPIFHEPTPAPQALDGTEPAQRAESAASPELLAPEKPSPHEPSET